MASHLHPASFLRSTLLLAASLLACATSPSGKVRARPCPPQSLDSMTVWGIRSLERAGRHPAELLAEKVPGQSRHLLRQGPVSARLIRVGWGKLPVGTELRGEVVFGPELIGWEPDKVGYIRITQARLPNEPVSFPVCIMLEGIFEGEGPIPGTRFTALSWQARAVEHFR